MKIGIIGAGNIGGALTRRFCELGYEVSVANSRGPETLGELAAETGARAVTVEEAARDKDLVVVTIPEKNIPNLPSDLFAGAPDEVVVVDTGNYYPQHRDGPIAAIEDGMAESRWVEHQLGHPVVKAFNNIYAQHLLQNGRPKGTPGRIVLPVAGDHRAAKSVVLGLVDELGFGGLQAMTVGDRHEPVTLSPEREHGAAVPDPPAVKRVTVASGIDDCPGALACACDEFTAALDHPAQRRHDLACCHW
jgi:8-hydroxy-5-deazaflavin:NADPH oxidoreductase